MEKAFKKKKKKREVSGYGKRLCCNLHRTIRTIAQWIRLCVCADTKRLKWCVCEIMGGDKHAQQLVRLVVVGGAWHCNTGRWLDGPSRKARRVFSYDNRRITTPNHLLFHSSVFHSLSKGGFTRRIYFGSNSAFWNSKIIAKQQENNCRSSWHTQKAFGSGNKQEKKHGHLFIIAKHTNSCCCLLFVCCLINKNSFWWQYKQAIFTINYCEYGMCLGDDVMGENI